jgi:predicted MFS family arabinose efflux permease
MFITGANESISIIYGVWMEEAFQISIAALGAASVVIGFSELSGEGLVAIFADRIGKRNSVRLGMIVNIAVCMLLSWIGQTLTGALIGLFFFYLSFEFTVVSTIPLMTELVPEARATTMSGLFAGLAAGRGIGALLGPLLFSYGMIANSALAATLNIAALVLLIVFVRE